VQDELRDVGGQLNGLGPNLADANKALTAARRSAEQEAGGRLQREMEEGHPIRRWIQDYGPLAMYIPGLIGGAYLRAASGRAANRVSEVAARKADDFVAGTGDVQSRIGGVNRFWQEGGASEIPFNPAPARQYAVRSNPSAPSATTLYPQEDGGALSHYLSTGDKLKLAALTGESGLTWYMAHRAQQEQDDAQAAVNDNPNELNLRRLDAARTQRAIWDSLSRLGQGAAFGMAGAAPFFRYENQRPNVNLADSERGRLDQLIRRGRGPGSASNQSRHPAGTPGGRGGQFRSLNEDE
jgi:hypothetical protein